MRLLKLGDTGADVELWDNFLRGRGFPVFADGKFDEQTKTYTKVFQTRSKLKSDGIVGSATWGAAMALGLSGVLDVDEHGADFPPLPENLNPYLNNAEREKDFGKFSYVAAPTTKNLEAIKITDGWDKSNIVSLDEQAISDIRARLQDSVPHGIYRLRFHKDIQPQMRNLLMGWAAQGLLSKILTWNGSYVPRFKRGSRTERSAHSWGTAFDINANENKLGSVPALVGATGCVRELVEIANQCGFYWGGHFKNRKDGMHFEVARKA